MRSNALNKNNLNLKAKIYYSFASSQQVLLSNAKSKFFSHFTSVL